VIFHRPFRFRFLPLAIVMAGAALTSRVGVLWHDLDADPLPLTVTASAARAAAPEAPSPPAQGTVSEVEKALPGDVPLAEHKVTASSPESENPALDLSTMTEAEIKTLQQLAARHQELRKWEADLALRENLLKATEGRVEQKIGELSALKGTVEALLRKYDEEQEQKLKSLVAIYEKMKPKDAAAIFEEMDLDLLVDVLRRMKETKSAPIIAAMEPKKAEALTTALATRREPADLAQAKAAN
jgi:flagellar motility protein MotE (MotC chaperone)